MPLEDRIGELAGEVQPLDEGAVVRARKRHLALTPPPEPESPAVVICAGDHGVLARGVSPWPQEVTAAMVGNFCAGGAAANALARSVGARLSVLDVGVASELE